MILLEDKCVGTNVHKHSRKGTIEEGLLVCIFRAMLGEFASHLFAQPWWESSQGNHLHSHGRMRSKKFLWALTCTGMSKEISLGISWGCHPNTIVIGFLAFMSS